MTRRKSMSIEEWKATPEAQAQGRQHLANTIAACQRAFVALDLAGYEVGQATQFAGSAVAILEDLRAADVNIKGLSNMCDDLSNMRKRLKLRIVRLKVVAELDDMSQDNTKEMTDEA